MMQKDSFIAVVFTLLQFSFVDVSMARTLVEIEKKTVQGCKAVVHKDASKNSNEKIIKIEWNGACKGGYLDGDGTAIQTYDDGVLTKTRATFRRGRAEGEGTAESVFVDGSKAVFRGNFIRGLPSGPGEAYLEYKNGDYEKFKGNFADGVPDGQGRLETPKWEFSGDVRGGGPSGNGVMTFKNGVRLTSFFSGGNPPSSGRIDYPNGSIYEGQLQDLVPHGKGRSTAPDGTGYAGDFKGGKPEGEGVVQQRDGSRFPVSISNGVVTRKKTQQELAQERYAAETRAREEQRRQEQQAAYERAVEACQARMANSVAPTAGNLGAMLAAAGQCRDNPGVQPPQPTVVVVPRPSNVTCTQLGAFVSCQAY